MVRGDRNTFASAVSAALIVLALLVCCLAAATPAAAQGANAAPTVAAPSAAEIALAKRYAPVVRLRGPLEEEVCDRADSYDPIDVKVLFDNEEVALRGPWDRVNLVDVGPSAERVNDGLVGYHLDFPGDTLSPGCDYAEWGERIAEGTAPTAYARVTREAGYPNQIALQYWFYYVFNEWNNNHEGDWEMIQLVFPVGTAEEALSSEPREVGYSQHSSGERARWGDEKLELVDGTHPVVYPAGGSHANFYTSTVYLMRSESEGMGCDNTLGEHRELRPAIDTVPSERADYLQTHPWLGFDGRWGEKQASVFNGPTGPADKLQWNQPLTWEYEQLRDRSFAVPTSGLMSTTRATDFFCGSVAAGSELLRVGKANPLLVAGLLAIALLLIIWFVTRTRWRPYNPRAATRPRAWGRHIATAAVVFRRHPRLFLGIGLLFLPLGVAITLVQYLLFKATSLQYLIEDAGGDNAIVGTFTLMFGVFFAILGLAVVQATVARALREINAGHRISALGAYRSVLTDWRVLLVALAIAVVVQAVLQISIVLVPLAVFVLVRWSLLAVVIGAEGYTGVGPLRRSAELSRGNWFRVAGMVIGVTGLAIVLGPAVGAIALILTSATFGVINLVAAIVYVAAVPLSAIALTLLYHDLCAREEQRVALGEPDEDDETLPAPV